MCLKFYTPNGDINAKIAPISRRYGGYTYTIYCDFGGATRI